MNINGYYYLPLLYFTPDNYNKGKKGLGKIRNYDVSLGTR